MSTPSFGPYRVRNSGWSVDRVFSFVNKNCFLAPGPEPSRGVLRTIVNPVHAFERFMCRLREIRNTEFVTFRQAFATPRPRDKIRVVIRHDLDNDFPAARHHARIENRLRIPATYFIQHTARYYGLFDRQNAVFRRNECMRHYYLNLQDMGHELGLHNDALWVYQQWQMDGAQALVEELNWLRSCGLEICGSAAHNFLGVYGAENYEIFKGTDCLDWQPSQPGDYKTEHEVCCNGRKAALRVLDPDELGLSYEANDLTLRGKPPTEYGMARFVNQWFWSLQLRRNSTAWKRVKARLQRLAAPGADPPSPPASEAYVDDDLLLADISRLAPGTVLMLNIHPVYYGCRYAIDKGPPTTRNRVSLQINEQLGWQTYAPGELQCYFKKDPAGDSRQNISWANEWGMLDKPWSRYPGQADLKILILGSDMLDARHVMVDTQCQVLLERCLQEALDREVFVFKLAFAGMGVDRLWPWYQKVNAAWKADIVIVGIDGDALGKNLPEIWSQRTGFSAKYPPGDYLSWDPVEEKFKIYPRSREWKIRQSAARDVWAWPRGGQDLVQTMIEGRGFPLGNCDSLEYLDRLYGFVLDGIRRDGAAPALLLEGLGTRSIGDGMRVPLEPTSSEGRKMRARLAGFAKEHGVDLIDPYGTFADDPWERRATHADGTWTYAGHRMAAECIFRDLPDLPACRQLEAAPSEKAGDTSTGV